MQGKEKNIVIRNAKHGTIYIDSRIYYERTLDTVNFTIPHECYHWHRHQPYHALMKMIGANDLLGKTIQYTIETTNRDSEKWNAVDWMEWQANGVASHILMPTKTAKIKAEQLFQKYQIFKDGNIDAYRLEEMIAELADFYGLSKLAVKHRMLEMGYIFAEGVCTYVNGKYVTPFSFGNEALEKNQSFTITSFDLVKAYCLNKSFRDVIDTGALVYIDGQVCINNEKYVCRAEIGITLTYHALSHIDECCLIFHKGYSYESQY